jgi:hypothetical protein
MILAEATTISIEMNWPAVAALITILGTAAGVLGGLFMKFNNHASDNKRHVVDGEHFVSAEVCEVTKNSIKDTIDELRKYIGDVKQDLLTAIQNS